MSSIFHENIINIITQYTAEEYIVSFEKTEIVAVIPLCKNCRTFCQFRNKCHECIAKDRLEKIVKLLKDISKEQLDVSYF
jgi:hypothetical protein